MVVDWNRLYNGEYTVSESHAFGYRWDGVKYESEMISDFDSSGVLDFYIDGYVKNIEYLDTDEPQGKHVHIEDGSWSFASSSNPYAYWGEWGNTEWDFNGGVLSSELLVDGQFEGVNAIMWFSELPDYADDQLDIPIVPEPGMMSLVFFGAVFLRRKIF
jgi:hypothetical protein